MPQHRLAPFVFAVLALVLSQVSSVPSPSRDLRRRQTVAPYFPDSPQSCQICAPEYANISSCAASAYLFQNFTQIIFEPSGFIDVIKCSCTDTFESYFPQCVDCFIQTNQTDVLNSNNLPSLVSGMRQVCAFASTLFGGVASADGQVPSASVAAPVQTATASSAALKRLPLPISTGPGIFPLVALLLGLFLGAVCLL